MNQFPPSPRVSHWNHFEFFENSLCTTGINDTGGKFGTGVNHTGGKFAAGELEGKIKLTLLPKGVQTK
jgi:hypothetical protein